MDMEMAKYAPNVPPLSIYAGVTLINLIYSKRRLAHEKSNDSVESIFVKGQQTSTFAEI